MIALLPIHTSTGMKGSDTCSMLPVKRLRFGEREREKKKGWKEDMAKSSLLLTKADFFVFPSESAHLPSVPLNNDHCE